MENKIFKISDIPYCGSIYIEGYQDLKTLEIKEYSGTNNPQRNWDNKEYFLAKWVGVRNKYTLDVDCCYYEIFGDL